MPVNRYYSSVAQPTTLSGSISAGATSITVGAATGFPSTTPFTLALDYGAATEELVDVTGVAGTTLTVTRGVDGTSAQSHSLGAAVRHVASGRDFAELQTHQAATAAIHGVAGTLVGTSDTQTLSNKTLSGAALSGGGSISGTFTGTPTFSGSVTLSGGGSMSGTWAGTPTFSGTHTHTAAVSSARANALDSAFDAKVTGDAQARLVITEDGTMAWGDGTASRDAFLFRSGPKALGLNDTMMRGARTISSDGVFSGRVTGDAFARWYVEGTGKHWWGNGGGGSDTNLYRSSAGVLATDGTFLIKGRPALYGESGVQTISFTDQTSQTVSITFGTAFPVAPRVFVNIASGAGGIARWGARAIQVTTTGFQIFVFSGSTGETGTWSSIPVHWTAIAA